MKQQIVIPIIVAFIFGAGGFYSGMKYQQSTSRQIGLNGQFGGRNQSQGGMMPQGGAMGQNGTRSRAGFRPVTGEITAVDTDSITVELEDGSSKIVLLTDETTINKAEAVEKDQLIKGVTVSVMGQEDADGIVSAQSVQLDPVNLQMPQ